MLIKDLFEAFQVGKSLTNSALWKNRTLAANTLTTFIALGLSISAAFGYTINIDHDTLQLIAGGITGVICLFNSGVTIVTSDKVGLSPSVPKEPPEPPQVNHEVEPEPTPPPFPNIFNQPREY